MTWEPPAADLRDPAQIEALFGPFGHWEHWRKVVLANCEEIVRAQHAAKKIHITEKRIEALGRTHENYLGFLGDGLMGRVQRERNVRESLRGGA